MNKLTMLLAAGVFLSLDARPAHATAPFRWNGHAAPFTFLYGNDIDNHQLSRLTGDGALVGFLYIQLTGVVTSDRYRVATHGDCNTASCTVGWTFSGRSITATLLKHSEHDHPLFAVERADIPQPGAFSHFHWLDAMPMQGETATGYVLQLLAVDRFCFIHHDATMAMSTKTCGENGGIEIAPGFDVASHLNIVPTIAQSM
jgi:hypothetical protein